MIRSKFFLLSAVVALGLLGLTGCATENSGSVTSKTDENSAVEEATLTTRTVTFPAIYFGEADQAETIASFEDEGWTDIEAHEDGSYTVTMPISDYNTLVDELKVNVEAALDDLPNTEDCPHITGIEYDESFAKISLITNVSSTDNLTFAELFMPMTAGVIGCMYQQIAGFDVSCEVSVVGSDGGVLDSVLYPDALEEMSADEH